ncbi:MAG: hypothetical protein PHR83_07985 [Paludibacter sp.]|nr:hypothetical protein [Paludibacter sp.]
MHQKIYFGSVIIQHIPTGEKQAVKNIIFLDSDTPPGMRLRAYVLKHIAPKERDKYTILRFCTESAKVTGVTAY